MPTIHKSLVPVSGIVAVPATLTFSATIATDITNTNNFVITVPVAGGGGQNFTLSNPTIGGIATANNTAYDMMIVVWRIKQATDSARTITLDTKFRFGTDITSVALSTTLGKWDYLAARYHATDDKFDVISVVKGF